MSRGKGAHVHGAFRRADRRHAHRHHAAGAFSRDDEREETSLVTKLEAKPSTAVGEATDVDVDKAGEARDWAANTSVFVGTGLAEADGKECVAMRRALLLASVGTFVGVLVSACLDRPVTATEPRTSNLYVEPIRYEEIDKIDLLFMIDNSQSMGDKQRLLAEAVPQLVSRLVVPRCVTKEGAVIHNRLSVDEACPAGSKPEFRAVKDIHVAVITSSLGALGANDSPCAPDAKGHPNDRALLLPSVREGLTSYNGTGFLAWDPDGKLTP